MNMKKVSIVVPVYNAGHKLKRCLDSVIAQSYRNLQIILADDGSTDNSLELCREYAALDERITVLHHENHGVSYTRNRGISAADGDYLMFWDADDQVLLDMVQRYLEQAEKNRADIVIGGIRFCEQSGNQYDVTPEAAGVMHRQEFASSMCISDTGIFGYVPNKLYRMSLIQDHAIRFREDMKAQEDLEFALSAYQKAERFVLFPYCGYLYDYAPSGRVVPAGDLIGNQQKLLRIAENAGVSREASGRIIKRIQDLSFTSLFHSKTEEEIVRLSQQPLLMEDLKKRHISNWESRLVTGWFLSEKFGTVLRYFKFRNNVKKILGK